MINKEIEIGSFKSDYIDMIPVLVQNACRYESNIEFNYLGRRVNAKSIMGMMALIFKPNSTIEISVDGKDEEEAFKTMAEFIENSTK